MKPNAGRKSPLIAESPGRALTFAPSLRHIDSVIEPVAATSMVISSPTDQRTLSPFVSLPRSASPKHLPKQM
eukprot:SAG11_NODE_5922_length_1432_cov_1.568642_1_plen_72_part_00